ncbi:hypothetical protein LC612_18435 [Nostoc sp. CHAB 5834]|nr:hypothetical protein [Nostoc sp. CHAB 5834]
MYEVILRGDRFCDRISWIWINLQNGKIQDAIHRVSTRGNGVVVRDRIPN